MEKHSDDLESTLNVDGQHYDWSNGFTFRQTFHYGRNLEDNCLVALAQDAGDIVVRLCNDDGIVAEMRVPMEAFKEKASGNK